MNSNLFAEPQIANYGFNGYICFDINDNMVYGKK